jgi:hypothetical protein
MRATGISEAPPGGLHMPSVHVAIDSGDDSA